MRLLKMSTCVMLLLLLSPATMRGAGEAEPGMKVWAIGDYVRIDPLSGKAFEDEPLLFPECLTGNYAEKNLVWDGATKTILGMEGLGGIPITSPTFLRMASSFIFC